MSHIAIKINWYGPYMQEQVDAIEDGNGLYLLTGKRKYQRDDPKIQYFGITERPFRERLNNYHHKLSEITKELEIWLGYIEYPTEYSRAHLEMAETILVYFWQPELNERKKINIPSPITIVSHWFKPDGNARINQRSIYRDLPDVISWDGYHWRTGNLNVYEA